MKCEANAQTSYPKKISKPPPPLQASIHFYLYLPPAYVRTFNTEYYPLLITQNRNALKTSKVLESFYSILDFLNDALIGVKIRNENQKHTKGLHWIK